MTEKTAHARQESSTAPDGTRGAETGSQAVTRPHNAPREPATDGGQTALSDEQLDAIEASHAAYRASHDHPGAFACCSAHAAADNAPALLAEVRRQRAELAAYEPLNPQQCPAGKHADWLVDSEYTHACPWCRIAELERPAVEAKRNEIRQSYAELVAAAEETKDFEGAFDVQCRLRDREEQWACEDAAKDVQS